jgi:transcription antitermination factor NusG
MKARKSRLRRETIETLRYRDVVCHLGSACVWPECSCPKREGTGGPETERVQSRGKRVYRTPAGPHVKRRVRPKGWTPLSDWVVVRTKTRSENFAANECRNQDMETWCPRYMEPGKGVPTALFPGYIFVKPGDRWRSLRNTYGVIDIIMMGDKPDMVPKAVMNALRRNADKDGIVTLPKQRKPELKERVQIKVGAWQGFEGLYDGLDPEGRIQVLFSMFGKTITLKFKRQASIEVVEA